MTVTNIVIDPNGDTIIALKYPKYEFEDFQYPPEPSELALPQIVPAAGEDVTSSPSNVSAVDDAFGNLSIEEDTAEEDVDENDQVNHSEFHYLVSHRQLRIASPYFDNTFRHGFAESKLEDGKYRVETEDFHPEALAHVLNAIHVQNDKVPFQVSLEEFAQIAVIADYYDIKHALSLWIRKWMSNSGPPGFYFPFSRIRNDIQGYLLWLFITLVFKDSFEARDAAIRAMFLCPDFTQNLDLPLNSILDKLFEHRQQAATSLIEEFNRFEGQVRKFHEEWESVDCDKKSCNEAIVSYFEHQRSRLRLLFQKKGTNFLDVMESIRKAPPWDVGEPYFSDECDSLEGNMKGGKPRPRHPGQTKPSLDFKFGAAYDFMRSFEFE